MIKLRFIFIFTLLPFLGQSQIIQSSCDISDEFRKQYAYDSKILASRQKINHGNAFLPDALSDLNLEVLAVIFNTNLPEKDTIFNQQKIHIYNDPLKILSFSADTIHHWVNNLENDIYPLGFYELDSILDTYHLKKENFYSFLNLTNVEFSTDMVVNIPYIVNYFKGFTDILEPQSGGGFGDGDDITFTESDGFTEVNFRKGWGDCPSGCTQNRNWVFRVFSDCKVEFVGSYGDKIETSSDEITWAYSIEVYPIPFKSYLEIKGLSIMTDYKIYNQIGKEILVGQTKRKIRNLDFLDEGVYYLKLEIEDDIRVLKLIK